MYIYYSFPLRGMYYYAHFTDEKTDTQKLIN